MGRTNKSATGMTKHNFRHCADNINSRNAVLPFTIHQKCAKRHKLRVDSSICAVWCHSLLWTYKCRRKSGVSLKICTHVTWVSSLGSFCENRKSWQPCRCSWLYHNAVDSGKHTRTRVSIWKTKAITTMPWLLHGTPENLYKNSSSQQATWGLCTNWSVLHLAYISQLQFTAIVKCMSASKRRMDMVSKNKRLCKSGQNALCAVECWLSSVFYRQSSSSCVFFLSRRLTSCLLYTSDAADE